MFFLIPINSSNAIGSIFSLYIWSQLKVLLTSSSDNHFVLSSVYFSASSNFDNILKVACDNITYYYICSNAFASHLFHKFTIFFYIIVSFILSHLTLLDSRQASLLPRFSPFVFFNIEPNTGSGYISVILNNRYINKIKEKIYLII